MLSQMNDIRTFEALSQTNLDSVVTIYMAKGFSLEQAKVEALKAVKDVMIFQVNNAIVLNGVKDEKEWAKVYQKCLDNAY